MEVGGEGGEGGQKASQDKEVGDTMVCPRRWELSWIATALVGSSQKGGCRVMGSHVLKRPPYCAKEFALCSGDVFFKMRVVIHSSTVKSI